MRHELIERYLDDLARMLDGVDPEARAEVLGGVREHIDASLDSLGREPTDSDVWRVLGDLGPPEAVAAEALQGQGHGYGQGPSAAADPFRTPATQSPLLARSWVPLLVTIALALCLPLTWVLFLGTPQEMIAGTILMVAPFYIPIAIVILASPLWHGWTSVVALWTPWIGPIGLWLAKPLLGPNGDVSGPWVAIAILLALLSLAALAVTYRSGHRAWRDESGKTPDRG